MFHAPPPSALVDAVPADPTSVGQPDFARALVERQVATLAELAAIGMQIAGAATRRAVAALDGEADAADRRDPSLAYARAARAVRMCIALQSRLLGELPALERAERMAGLERRGARKRQIVHLVRTVAESEHADEIEQISGEAWERLNDTDEYSAVMNGSLREAVARICDDLDVTPDWSLWGGEFEAKDPSLKGEDRGIGLHRPGIGRDERDGADPGSGPPPDPPARGSG